MKAEIAIIGASSAGLYAAEQLALTGKHVVVFEGQQDINPARRTLIITPQLRQFFPAFPPELIIHQTKIMKVATQHATTQVSLEDPDWIVERGMLAQFLLDRARAAGAEIRLGHRFVGMSHESGEVSLEFKTQAGNARCAAQTIIGADGVISDLAKAAKIPLAPRVPILQAEVNLPSDWDPAVTQVWFNVDETRYFYWLIPESADRGVVGLVGDDRNPTQDLLNSFLDRLHLEPSGFQGAQVAMYHPQFKPWGRVEETPVYLIGDAAGQVKVTTVGGTVSGFWGASAAVKSIVEGIPYNAALRPLKRELILHWMIRSLLERLDNPGFDDLVRVLNPSVLGFLSRHNRDDMAGVIWKMPFLQPRILAATGVRLLLQKPPSYQKRPVSTLAEPE